MKQGDETQYRDDITYRRAVQREFHFPSSLRPLHRRCHCAAPRAFRLAVRARRRVAASSRTLVPQRVIESRRVVLTARIAYPIIRSLTEQLIGRRAFAHPATVVQQERTGDSQ
ncbi:hypothetical protein [Burkholderia sola]